MMMMGLCTRCNRGKKMNLDLDEIEIYRYSAPLATGINGIEA
jgi:hypothetical protein